MKKKSQKMEFVQGFSRSTHGCSRRGLESEGFDILYVGDVNGFSRSS